MTFRHAAAISVLAAFSCVGAVRAQQSGVLIGVQEAPAQSQDAQTFDELSPPKYKTIWVAPDASGQLAVLATIPDLIVPRKDGFWHVGVGQACGYFPDPGGADEGNESMVQAVWRAPVAQAGIVPVSHLCAPRPAGDYAPSVQVNAQNKITQCGFQLTEIWYLSPAVISVKRYSGQSEDCEPRGGHYSDDSFVVEYNSDENLSVGEFLGPDAEAAYRKALPASGKSEDGDDCDFPSNIDSGWLIQRRLGRWSIAVHQDLGPFGCAIDAPVRFRLPLSVTSDNSPVPDWKTLQASVKDLQDAYVSPAGNRIVIMTSTELQFCEFADGKPGKVLLHIPVQPIVMLQWSTGTHVQDWTNQLTELAKHPLPPPKVQVEPRSY
jgi:hypothetical protein